jgi:hypothetical protein
LHYVDVVVIGGSSQDKRTAQSDNARRRGNDYSGFDSCKSCTGDSYSGRVGVRHFNSTAAGYETPIRSPRTMETRRL